jgi:hypothetical protein
MLLSNTLVFFGDFAIGLISTRKDKRLIILVLIFLVTSLKILKEILVDISMI